MANKRISELTSITGANLADADLLVVVDVSDTTMASSGTNKKITMAELAKDSALTDNLIAKTTLTTDGDVLTRAAGAPARITRADLAADSAFSSRYVSKTEDDLLVVGAGEMVAAFGSPAIARIITYYSTWAMDAASSESLGFNTMLPQHWATFHADVITINTTAGSGDIRWTFHRSIVANGASMSGSNTSVTVAVGSQNVLTYQRLLTGATNTAESGIYCYLERDGGNAADTFASDLYVAGVLFTKAS